MNMARVLPPRKARMGYEGAVAWVAENDEPLKRDFEFVSGMISVLLVADIFDVPSEKVANDVVCYRIEHEVGR